MINDFDLRDALCRGCDPELWFPPGAPGSPGYERLAAPARAVCAVCPVRDACLAWALAVGPTDGIFAGLDPAQRATLRRAARRASRRVA
jgi:WhiB family redox-sensing transcriptional regulator